MSIRRVVPDIQSDRFPASREFYVEVLGFEVGMEMDWAMILVSPTNPTAQVTLISQDASAAVQPEISVGGRPCRRGLCAKRSAGVSKSCIR